MAADTDPIVGNWYEYLDEDKRFQVVDVDEETGVIEIQYFDGDLDQIDIDEWYELDIESIEAPEDWTGAVDAVEQDDLVYMESDLEPKEWSLADQEMKRRRAAREEPEEESLDSLEEDEPKEEGWEEED